MSRGCKQCYAMLRKENGAKRGRQQWVELDQRVCNHDVALCQLAARWTYKPLSPLTLPLLSLYSLPPTCLVLGRSGPR